MTPSKRDALTAGLEEGFDLEEVTTDQLDPGGADGIGVFG